MDFENLVWIIPVIYLLRRLLFGSRKQKHARKPSAQAPRPALSQKNRDDLQEGLGEIGRALGLPADLFQERGGKTMEPPAPLPVPFAQAESAARLPVAATEETVAYDAWEEPDYETDAWFADEEAFETEENAPFRDIHAENLKKEGDDFGDLKKKGDPVETPAPREHTHASGHALRRLAATASLQEAVLLKEVLGRPVSLRRSPRLPFRN